MDIPAGGEVQPDDSWAMSTKTSNRRQLHFGRGFHPSAASGTEKKVKAFGDCASKQSPSFPIDVPTPSSKILGAWGQRPRLSVSAHSTRLETAQILPFHRKKAWKRI